MAAAPRLRALATALLLPWLGPAAAELPPPTSRAPPLDDVSLERLAQSSRPAFVLVVAAGCHDRVCTEMSNLWDLIETHMPGIAWRCACGGDASARPRLCAQFWTGDVPNVVLWAKGSWQPYAGPRKADALLGAVKAHYEAALGTPAAGSEGPEVDAFEAAVAATDLSDSRAILALAVPAVRDEHPAVKERAYGLLERAFSPAVDAPLSGATEGGRALAYQIFVHRWSEHDYPRGRAALVEALRGGGEHCWRLQLATLLSKYPESEEDADLNVRRYREEMEALLALPAIELRDEQTYNFCLFSLFDHSFYYRADLRYHAALHSRVTLAAFPQLRYTPPAAVVAPRPGRACGERVRLGIASGCWGSASHPVPSDFGGVLDRLPRDRFDVTYVYFDDLGQGSAYLAARNDSWLHLSKPDDPAWLATSRRRIGALRLDVLLYLDLTMSEMAQQTAHGRLAPVTAVSHGHPVTSGIGRDAMDWYVSWAAAELPTAQEHYTERLALLPARTMHQYYESRVAADGVSSQVDGAPFRHLRRADFAGVPAARRWYLCMQKPFKLQPAFDALLAGVHAADPEGVLVLHEVQHRGSGATSPHNKRTFVERLRRAGVDVARLHFVRQQPHHRLLALYSLADVVLDSYYAGGCTTTREALEVGGLVVTLPAKYLGSRWSLAYYSIMGVTELVARDRRDYVRIAVRMATDARAAAATRQRIRDNVHKLFYQEAAVHAWSELLARLASPVTSQCVEPAKEKAEL